MKEQQELDFSKGEKLWILRRVSERDVITPRMLIVLRAIDDLARNEPAVEASLAQLGQYSGQSRDTAKRGVADLVRNHLLIKETVKTGRGVQANRYKIVWPALRAIADGEAFELIKPGRQKPAAESAQVVKAASGQIEVAPGHSAPTPGAQCPDPPVHSAPAILCSPLRINPPSQSPGSDWRGVEENLVDLGLAAPQAAISRARANGCQPADVLALIDHARSMPGAWGPGAVFSRVSAAIPGTDPAAGWPKPADTWQQQQKRQEQLQQINQNTQQAARLRAEKQAKRQANAALIRDYGAALDDLSDAERLELARGISIHLASRLKQNPEDYRLYGCRLFLLDALKKRDTEFCQKGIKS